MYNFYRSNCIDIWDYNEIANYKFSDFVRPLHFKGGRKYIIDHELNLRQKIDTWGKIFEGSFV